MSRQPSLKKIISVDWTAMTGAAGVIGIVTIYALMVLTVEVSLSNIGFTVAMAVLTLAFAALLAWRVLTINAVFRDGVEARATLESVHYRNGQGRVSYRYTFRGREYRSSVFIIPNDDVKAMSPGGQVVVVIDRNKPKRALIRDLYA